jgi:hypothetical protein
MNRPAMLASNGLVPLFAPVPMNKVCFDLSLDGIGTGTTHRGIGYTKAHVYPFSGLG